MSFFAMMKQAERYREYLGLAAWRRRLRLRHEDALCLIQPRFRPAVTIIFAHAAAFAELHQQVLGLGETVLASSILLQWRAWTT